MRAPAAPCINTCRQALCRVFVPPMERTRLLPLPVSVLLPCPRQRPGRGVSCQVRSYVRKPPPGRGPRGQTSAAATEQVARDERGFDKRYTTQTDIDRSGRDRPPRDHEITDPEIMVIDNGVSEGPLSTSYVLTKLEAHESLRMIQPYVPADRKDPDSKFSYAVCKIVNKADEYERQKQLKEKKKAAAGKAKTKEMELTWAIGDHDLGTKMRQMGGFLAKGFKVEVLVAKKKGGKQVDGREAEAVVRRLREAVEQNGGREAKPATGTPGGTMRFYLEGKQD
ncbi:hypothetical protein E4U54_005161 [Claviceps lovelessii]|nr:hypothetical protein E4U54_005161 [Claviceps lovelessii]